MTTNPRLPVPSTARLRRSRRAVVASGALADCERELAIIRDRRSWSD